MKNYQGYRSPEQKSLVLSEKGPNRVDYYYELETAQVTFVDRVKDSRTMLGAPVYEDRKIGTSVAGMERPGVAQPGNNKTAGAYYDNYSYDSCTIETVKPGGVTVYREFVLVNAQYKVIHKLQEKADSNIYVTADTDVLTGEVGRPVTPEPKTIYGPSHEFVPPRQTVTIKADGSTEVIYKYDYARYPVTFIDQVKGGDNDGEVLSTSMERMPYGTEVSAGDVKGYDPTPGRYYEGYRYLSCTTAVVRESGTTVYRYFAEVMVQYTVRHILVYSESNETLAAQDQLEARVGSQVTPEVRTFEGFTSPEPQTVTVKADGTTVVEYRYTKGVPPVPPVSEDCVVTYVDKVKGASTELGRQTKSVKEGTSVAGSDIGYNTTPGYYYEGYAYDTCTNATATKLGVTVYRYFVESDPNPDPPGPGDGDNDKEVDYRVTHQKEQLDGTYRTEETKVYLAKALTYVTPDVKQYEGYISPNPQRVQVKADGTTEVIYRYRLAIKNSGYTVIHQQEQLEGSFKTEDTESGEALVGSPDIVNIG